MLHGLFTLRSFVVALLLLFAVHLLKALERIYQALQGIRDELANLKFPSTSSQNNGGEDPIDRIPPGDD